MRWICPCPQRRGNRGRDTRSDALARDLAYEAAAFCASIEGPSRRGLALERPRACPPLAVMRALAPALEARDLRSLPLPRVRLRGPLFRLIAVDMPGRIVCRLLQYRLSPPSKVAESGQDAV